MGLIWSAAIKDLRRRLRDPLSLVLWLGIPVVVGGMILLAFGRGGDTIRARVLVADEDGSIASNLFTGALARVPVLESESIAADEGRRRLEAGQATALLVIPAGFGDSLIAEREITLPLITNPAQRILPDIVEEVVETIAEAGFYVQRLLAPALPEIRAAREGGGPTNDQILRVGAVANGAIGRSRGLLFPPALKLEVERIGPDEPPGGMGALFFPGILFMSLIFMSQGVSADIWQEAESGTLRRVTAAPRPLAAFVAGKLLAGAMLMACVNLLGLGLGVAAFELSPARVPLALAWATFSGTVFTAALTVLQLSASSARTAGVMTSMVVFPLLMVGGSFFPFATMPGWLAGIGRWTPNGWALLQLERILSGGIEPMALALAFAGLAAIVGLSIAVAPRVLRLRFGMI